MVSPRKRLEYEIERHVYAGETRKEALYRIMQGKTKLGAALRTLTKDPLWKRRLLSKLK